MRNHTTEPNGDDPGGAPRRRWTAGAATVVAVMVVVVGATCSTATTALIPQPTTTTRSRPTTSAPVTTRPRPTTTSAVQTTVPIPTTTSPPNITSPEQVTTSPALPTTTTRTESNTTPAVNPPDSTTTVQPVPEPPTSEFQTAPFVMSAPVVVDPESPVVQPPVIVDVTTYCVNGSPGAKLLVQNVDTFHYPVPFEAFYDWSLTDANATVLDDGHLQLLAWGTDVIYLDIVDPGAYLFTVTDTALGAMSSAEVVLPDCANQPAPAMGPFGPLVLVPSVTCAEDFGPNNGSGVFTFAVQNQPNDDDSARDYDFAVTWTQQQTLVDSGDLGSLGNTHWIIHDVKYVHSGTFMVNVTDADDAALVANVSVEVSPCAPDVPSVGPVAPLAAPQILHVTPHCADPVQLDGWAEFIVLNANYLFLGGTGDLTYDWTLESDSAVIESFNGYFHVSGAHMTKSPPLGPGTYTATITAAGFPDLTDSATFEILDCSGPQPDYGLVVYGVSTLCLPGDATEALYFVIDHYADPNIVGWSINDGQGIVAGKPEVHFEGDQNNQQSARHVPAGSYELTVSSLSSPGASFSTPIEIGSCLAPADQPETTEPATDSTATEPIDPSATTGTVQEGGPTTAVTAGSPADATGSTAPGTLGTLPATGAGVTGAALVAALVAVSGLLLLAAARARHVGVDVSRR